MVITIVMYVLLAACLLWGIKYAGPGKFHESPMDMDVTKSLGGFAAIAVIMHHISQEEIFQEEGILPIFVQVGFYCVAIFFFISGYGLLKSLDQKENYLDNFLKKRLPVIIVPFYTSAVIYTVFRLVIGEKMPAAQIVLGLLGFVMANEYAWYPIILTILYLAFYFIFKHMIFEHMIFKHMIFKHMKNRSFGIFIIFLITLVLGAIFCVNGHFVWWKDEENWWLMRDADVWWKQQKIFWLSGEWWVNSTIAFVLGLIYANHEEKLVSWFKKSYAVKVIALLILTVATRELSMFLQATVGYWSEWSGMGPGIWNKMVCYVGQLPEVASFTILIFVLLLKVHTINPISRFFGKYSYETYMMNLLALMLARPILYNIHVNESAAIKWNEALFILVVIALSIILGIVYKKLNGILLKRK